MSQQQKIRSWSAYEINGYLHSTNAPHPNDIKVIESAPLLESLKAHLIFMQNLEIYLGKEKAEHLGVWDEVDRIKFLIKELENAK